jgi:tetraprenyl-beta-curcumene synthase
MPANPIRDDALSSLDTKRFHAEGAALFATLPRRRDERLLRLLVAYELLWDFLDSVSERPCADIVANGRWLHQALVEALDPDAPVSDYYRHHPWRDDGGYLRALVEACREVCRELPSFPLVRSRAIQQAARAQVCALNHDPSPGRRDERLEAWVTREYPDAHGFRWYELSAAASASLAVHALFALAAEPDCDERRVAVTVAAYSPWVNLACTMLDSFSDLDQDATNGDHNYLSHYPTREIAFKRLQEIVHQSGRLVRELPRGARHAILATGMVSMYLSKDSACTPELRPAAHGIMRAAGRLPFVLWPILRVWRRVTGQGSC